MNKITGIVRKLTDVRTGTSAAGNSWASQTVVLEYGEQIQIEAAFDFDPDRKPEFASLQNGDEVTIGFYPKSSASKTGSYFTTLIPTRLEVIRQASPAAGRRAVNSEAPPTPTPTPSSQPAAAPAEETDDLPF
jgi:hypothetical protein